MMIPCDFWGPCRKEFERLQRKFRTLEQDLDRFKTVLLADPIGPSQHRTILYKDERVTIIKGKLFCESLRKNSLRIVYAYHHDRLEVLWIEIFHKADKENEDRERIREYLKSMKK